MLVVGLDSKLRATTRFDGIHRRNVPNADSGECALSGIAQSRPGSEEAHTVCAENRPESAWIRLPARGAAFAFEPPS